MSWFVTESFTKTSNRWLKGLQPGRFKEKNKEGEKQGEECGNQSSHFFPLIASLLLISSIYISALPVQDINLRAECQFYSS